MADVDDGIRLYCQDNSSPMKGASIKKPSQNFLY